MNIKLIIWIVGTFLAIVVVSVIWYVMLAPKTVMQTTQPTTTLPISGSITPIATPPTTTSSQSVQTMALTTQSGNVVTTNDFVHNGVTIQDRANTGRYLLAGNLDYCLSDSQECQAGSSTNYNIYYESALQSFVIALTEEPIGQARLDMEQFLLPTLGITQQQMCSLNYYVGVTMYLNPQFTGKNLGFSFCPGATVLPK
jgi:hypothetical protein